MLDILYAQYDYSGQVNTVFQLLLVAAALLQPELGTPQTQTYITYLRYIDKRVMLFDNSISIDISNKAKLIFVICYSWLVASTTVGSTAAYGVQHMRNKPISIARGC